MPKPVRRIYDRLLTSLLVIAFLPGAILGLTNAEDAAGRIDRLDGRTVYMKGGALPGVCTWMLFLPDEDLCIILLSNRSAGEPRCGQVALEIAKLALAP